MNRVILMGRLTKDPELRYSQSNNPLAIARYTLAVARKVKTNDTEADFINCIAFGKSAEFVEKYFRQGQRVLIEGRLQTGSYINKDGKTIYTTDVIVDSGEFADSKGARDYTSTSSYTQSQRSTPSSANSDGFMSIPDGFEDDGLPFN